MKATELLKQDHEKVKGLIKKLKGEKNTRRQLLDTIEQEIKVHSQAEEEIFYPAMEPYQESLVSEFNEEHQEVDNLLAELVEGGETAGDFDEKVKRFEESLLHHIEEEEGQMFPEAEKQLKDQLNELGAQIASLKEDALGEVA